MACPEISDMRQQVCDRLRGNVNTWQYNLQARWGDPRVYEAEQEEMLREEARVVHDLSRRNSNLLSEAYAKQREKNRETHSARLTKVRAQNADRRPRSAAAPANSRTTAPP